MRFFFIGVVIIFLISLLIGQLTTPKKTPFRKVFRKGLYFSLIGLIGFGIAIGVVTLVNDIVARGGSDSEFSKMTREQKQEFRMALKKELPAPTLDNLKATFVNYNFNGVLIPCYETVHKLDIASLKNIKAFEVDESRMSNGFFEIGIDGEFLVNQPVPNFHISGTFNVQYEFYEGDSNIDPGWKFKRIFINDCEVIDAPPKKKVIGNTEYYPDL